MRSHRVTKMHIHKWRLWWTHAGKRNDTHSEATGYSAYTPFSKDLSQPEVGANLSCANPVDSSLNGFNFSSSGYKFASFYKGHYKSHGGKKSLWIHDIIFCLKYTLKEWAAKYGLGFFVLSWMMLKFFHGLDSKSCWLVKHFINMK